MGIVSKPSFPNIDTVIEKKVSVFVCIYFQKDSRLTYIQNNLWVAMLSFLINNLIN